MANNYRFNLVLHGMMLVVETKDGIEVIVPAVDEHAYKYGKQPYAGQNPYPPDSLADIQNGDRFRLQGVTEGKQKLRGLLAAAENLVLDTDKVDVLESKTHEYARISLPSPKYLRSFRTIELAKDIAPEAADKALLLAQPRLMHEATALGWDVEEGAVVRFGAFRFVFTPQQLPTSFGASLCVYAQTPITPVPVAGAAAAPHDTAFNHFLQRKNSAKLGAGQKTQFECSKIGEPERLRVPAASTALGPFHLWSLEDLSTAPRQSDDTGCCKAFVC